MKDFPRISNKDGMITVCRMVRETAYDDLPHDVTDFAKMHILDQMGCIIGGSSQLGIPEVVNFVKDKGGKEESLIPFYRGKVPASETAFAIGPMARALDMGDVSEEASHTAEHTLPAILAATGLNNKNSGRDFITAFVVGQEVMIRIGMGFNYDAPERVNNEGGHFIFGPTAGVGKLLDLNFEELQNAMGIANAMTQHWEMQMYAEGALSVRLHHGFVCQDAVNACLLAKRGLTGPHNILFGERGYYALHCRWTTYPDRVTEGLGKKWVVKNTMLKPYALCKCTHSAIEALVDLMQEFRFDAEDIDKIHIDESPRNWKVVCEPPEKKYNPQSIPECQFSLIYTIATAAYDKNVFIDSYSEKARKRENVRELMTRITMEKDSKIPMHGARVKVSLKDGRELSKETIIVEGHPKEPFTWEDTITKFKKNALLFSLPSN